MGVLHAGCASRHDRVLGLRDQHTVTHAVAKRTESRYHQDRPRRHPGHAAEQCGDLAPRHRASETGCCVSGTESSVVTTARPGIDESNTCSTSTVAPNGTWSIRVQSGPRRSSTSGSFGSPDGQDGGCAHGQFLGNLAQGLIRDAPKVTREAPSTDRPKRATLDASRADSEGEPWEQTVTSFVASPTRCSRG